ncbi:DNA-binding transcriptional regulator, MarR family [Micromonospora echinaurantiaca]|uniref:DNA-binding transcriptional regulator, MarR family n=1 Tax=Micromonospora echinaurantiaca TaxID=47857 RepID=A0A1C5HR10_9ACTN|nr:MarR family transcriptional regulator [Micromonospora echinaurantiaca]SCG48440.1 DNA-binding transcriptional regulator, MarR family [Micromonospora echinaurantiaca]
MSRARQELLLELQATLTQAVADAILVQQAAADRLGLGLADFKCLTALTEEGSATAGEIAQRTGLTSGAVTRMIDRLERAGWVRRRHDTMDRRRVIVEPVPARLAEIEPLFAGMAAGWSAALADYDDAQLRLLIDLFGRMRALARQQAAAIRVDA